MSDIIDQLSEGKTVRCPYSWCPVTRTDLDPSVANGLIANHVRKEHPNEEE